MERVKFKTCTIGSSLYSIVNDEESLERVKEIVDLFGLTCAKEWSEADLLCVGIKYYNSLDRRDITKLVLLDGEVNSYILLRCITPLHYAAMSGNIEVLEMLLDRRAKINTKDDFGRTALHYAVETNHIEIVKLLLNRGSSVNVRDQDGAAPLHIVERNCSETVETIKGPVQITELLINYGADVNIKDLFNRAPIFFAVENFDLTITKLLLDNGSHITRYPNILLTAVKKACININQMLLNKADINAKKEDGTTAHDTAIDRCLELVQILLECGADVDFRDRKHQRTPLHYVAKWGHPKIVELLLDFGADVNSRDKYGMTALHLASLFGLVNVVPTLLENGADINIKHRYDHYTAFESVIWPDRLKYRKNDDNDCLYHNTDSNAIDFAETVNIFIQNIVIMEADNIFVNTRFLQSLRTNRDIKQYYSNCQKEVTKMREEKFDNTNVLFYDILTTGIRQLAVYVGNENIVKPLESRDYLKVFPLYANMLDDQLRRGQERKRLLKSGLKSFNSLCGYKLPHLFVSEVFSHLPNYDLRNLIAAYPDASSD